jgi:hypothetical protein
MPRVFANGTSEASFVAKCKLSLRHSGFRRFDDIDGSSLLRELERNIRVAPFEQQQLVSEHADDQSWGRIIS